MKPFLNRCFLVLLGLFAGPNLLFGHFWATFGYVSGFPATWFWCHCTYWTLVWRGMTVKNFLRIVDSFWTKMKKFTISYFLVTLGLRLVMFLIAVNRFWRHCTKKTMIWCRSTLGNFIRVVRTAFEKIKTVNIWLLVVFGQIWLFLKYQLYDSNAVAKTRP